MRLIVNIPETDSPAKLPLPLKTDGHGRTCLVAPMVGVLVRLPEGDAARVIADRPAVIHLEVDSPDPAVAGVWMRERDLAQIGL